MHLEIKNERGKKSRFLITHSDSFLLTSLYQKIINLEHVNKFPKRAIHAHDKNYLINLGVLFPGLYLTEREAQCALLMILGFTSREIANQLHLSPRTIEYYQLKIKQKLNITHRASIIIALLKSDFVKNYYQLIFT